MTGLKRFIPPGWFGWILLFAAGWLGETNEGGFIRDIWTELKRASPAVAMTLAFLLYLVWQQWMKDREEHRLRTIDFTAIINRYLKSGKRGGRR